MSVDLMKTLKPIPGFSKYGITKCARPVNLKTKRTTIALQREYLRPGGVINNIDDIKASRVEPSGRSRNPFKSKREVPHHSTE